MIEFYCIYKDDDIRSTALLEDAINSGLEHGITVNSRPGIYSNIEQLLEQENLFINDAGEHKIKNNGVIGCFLSHYFLWKKSVENNKPVGILEYDAIFIKPLPDDVCSQFNDYLNLDYTRHQFLSESSTDYLEQIKLEQDRRIRIRPLAERGGIKQKDRAGFKYINKNHIKGAFGYVIKPSGAQKLITATKEFGILPADIQLNLLYCNVSYTTPSVVMLNPASLIERTRESHTTHDRTTR